MVISQGHWLRVFHKFMNLYSHINDLFLNFNPDNIDFKVKSSRPSRHAWTGSLQAAYFGATNSLQDMLIPVHLICNFDL